MVKTDYLNALDEKVASLNALRGARIDLLFKYCPAGRISSAKRADSGTPTFSKEGEDSLLPSLARTCHGECK